VAITTVFADEKREGAGMRGWQALARVAALAFALSALLGAVGSGTAYANDQSWKGPGWYEVLYTEDSGLMIYSGPYADKNTCETHVNDPAHAENMHRKYGPFGYHGFALDCIEMKTAADAPPEY
jgi:hypothetical protein